MPDLTEIIQEFLKKADGKTINIIVWVLGIVLIAFTVVILLLLVRKLYKTFLREDKYVQLLQEYNDIERRCENACKDHERACNITRYLVQLDLTVVALVNNAILMTKEQQEISEMAKKLIETMVYVIPQYFKINFADNHRCFIWTQKGDLNVLENTYSSTGEFQQDLNVSSSFAGRIFTLGEERNSPNVDFERDFQKRNKTSHKYKSLLGVPLKVEDKVIGVLTIDAKKENAFSEEDIVHLNLFASLISICTLLIIK